MRLFAVAAFAAATGSAHVSNLPKDQLDALSGIDVPITHSLIQQAFDLDPVDELVVLAHDADEDPGVRLRAYRALSLYPAAAPVLAADIDATSTQTLSGIEVLYLRAAIEALGVLQGSQGVTTHWEVLIPHLSAQHRDIRDIRAATAHALRVMGAVQSLDALRERKELETSPQVLLAIDEAIDALTP